MNATLVGCILSNQKEDCSRFTVELKMKWMSPRTHPARAASLCLELSFQSTQIAALLSVLSSFSLLFAALSSSPSLLAFCFLCMWGCWPGLGGWGSNLPSAISLFSSPPPVCLHHPLSVHYILVRRVTNSTRTRGLLYLPRPLSLYFLDLLWG